MTAPVLDSSPAPPPTPGLLWVVIDGGLAGRLSWGEVADALGRLERSEVDPAADPIRMLALVKHGLGRPVDATPDPAFWAGATPEEAFLFDLRPDFPGDASSGLMALADGELDRLTRLAIGPIQTRTASPWLRRWGQLLVAERRRREGAHA